MIKCPLSHPGQQINLDNGGSSSTQGGKIHVGNDPHYSRLYKLKVYRLQVDLHTVCQHDMDGGARFSIPA
ncbi:hypothetical protein Lal_00016223 [Lupinus albus]|nr:hypothetical protein Lal_00016223 [Lupinus albus]